MDSVSSFTCCYKDRQTARSTKWKPRVQQSCRTVRSGKGRPGGADATRCASTNPPESGTSRQGSASRRRGQGRGGRRQQERLQEQDHPSAAMKTTTTMTHKQSQRRLRRRKSQLKYRDKQAMSQLNLVLDVNDLRAQIAQYERVRSLLQSQQVNAMTQRTQSLVHRVRKFCDLFAHGLVEPKSSDPPFKHEKFARQTAFARWMMPVPFVRNDELVDVDHMLSRWQATCASHSKLRVEVISCQPLRFDQSDCIVQLVGRCHTQLCYDTLQRVFPHLVSDRRHQMQNQLLVQTLLNQRFAYNTRHDYYFDAHGHLVRQTAEIDPLPEMLRLLGSVRDALYVTERAILPAAPLQGHQNGHLVLVDPPSTGETKHEQEDEEKTQYPKHSVGFLLS